jgi:hypothetical protein
MSDDLKLCTRTQRARLVPQRLVRRVLFERSRRTLVRRRLLQLELVPRRCTHAAVTVTVTLVVTATMTAVTTMTMTTMTAMTAVTVTAAMSRAGKQAVAVFAAGRGRRGFKRAALRALFQRLDFGLGLERRRGRDAVRSERDRIRAGEGEEKEKTNQVSMQMM